MSTTTDIEASVEAVIAAMTKIGGNNYDWQIVNGKLSTEPYPTTAYASVAIGGDGGGIDEGGSNLYERWQITDEMVIEIKTSCNASPSAWDEKTQSRKAFKLAVDDIIRNIGGWNTAIGNAGAQIVANPRWEFNEPDAGERHLSTGSVTFDVTYFQSRIPPVAD